MYDFELPPEHFSIPRISILGSRTLARYSERILANGFLGLGWEVVPPDTANFVLLQIHGSPSAIADDRELLDILDQLIAKQGGDRIGVLIHRPDECLTYHPSLAHKLALLSKRSFVALLGTHFLKQPWLAQLKSRVKAVPHGFYTFKAPLQIAPQIVIGSITSWGEMRRVGDAVKLIAHLFKICQPGEFIGYLSGTPREDLTVEKVEQVLNELKDLPAIDVVSDYGLAPNPRHKHVIVVSHEAKQGRGLPAPSINIQLYHLNGAVRMGENSGSLHSYPNIPVVLEMNGAEDLEQLKVIKVSYSDPASIESADLAGAAKDILAFTRQGRHKTALQHNCRRAKQLSPQNIALIYKQLFTQQEPLEC